MKLIEADGLAAGRGLEPNPECNELEGNVTVPNGVVVAIEFPPVTDFWIWENRDVPHTDLGPQGLEEIVAERGWAVDHPIIWRWVEQHGPEVHRRLRGEEPVEFVEPFELCVFIADLVHEEVAQLASSLAFYQ